MNKREVEKLSPFEQEKVKDDGKDVFIITRYFTGTKTIEGIFEKILENHEDFKPRLVNHN